VGTPVEKTCNRLHPPCLLTPTSPPDHLVTPAVGLVTLTTQLWVLWPTDWLIDFTPGAGITTVLLHGTVATLWLPRALHVLICQPDSPAAVEQHQCCMLAKRQVASDQVQAPLQSLSQSSSCCSAWTLPTQLNWVQCLLAVCAQSRGSWVPCECSVDQLLGQPQDIERFAPRVQHDRDQPGQYVTWPFDCRCPGSGLKLCFACLHITNVVCLFC